MLSVEAIYENGHLLAGNEPLPVCRKKVIVTFLDEEPSNELSPEWKAEIDKRIADIDSGKAVMHDGEDVFKELTQKYK